MTNTSQFAPGGPTRAEFDALSAQVADHETRITTLEGGSITPPDPGPPAEESADGTEVPPAASIVTGYGETWALTAGQQITVDGNVLPESGGVVLLVYMNKMVYQTNSAGGWWCKAKSSDPWQDATDPRVPPVVPPDPSQRVQVPLGAYISTWFGYGGTPHYPNFDAHNTHFIQCLGGRVPTVYNCPGTPYPATNPDGWGIQTTYNLNNWPSTMPREEIMVNFWYVDAANRPIYDRATNGTQWSGGDLNHWIRATLDGYTTLGTVKVIYFRPAWEYNINFQGQGIPSGQLPQYIAAMQSFYTTVHAWGRDNGITARVMWNPAVYGQPTNEWTIDQQFPNQKAGDHFVDVISADFYAWGNCLTSYDNPSDPRAFTIPALVRLCQKWNLPFGFCELGDGNFNGQDPTITWHPDLVRYLGSLATMSPPVPIELMTLWDIETIEWSPPQVGKQTEIDAWNAAMGAHGSLMTIPVVR